MHKQSNKTRYLTVTHNGLSRLISAHCAADITGCSMATVNRWITGTQTPQEPTRRLLQAWAFGLLPTDDAALARLRVVRGTIVTDNNRSFTASQLEWLELTLSGVERAERQAKTLEAENAALRRENNDLKAANGKLRGEVAELIQRATIGPLITVHDIDFSYKF